MSVSTITYAYNQKPYLLDKAIRSCINMGADQVVLVDDGSDVPIENLWGDVVEIRRHAENRGIPAAYATAMEAVECDRVVRCMSDDVQHTNKLEVCDEWSDGVAVYHNYIKGQFAGGDVGGGVPVRLGKGVHAKLGEDNQFYGGATIIATDLLRFLGPHPEHLQLMQDWWLHIRISWEAGWSQVPGPLLMTQGVFRGGLHERLSTPQAQQERRWIRQQVAIAGGARPAVPWGG